MRQTHGRNDIAELFALVKDDYAYDDDVFNFEDERSRRAKQILQRLPESDRNIIILYAELGSLSKLGEALGVKKSTIRTQVKRIQGQIKALM